MVANGDEVPTVTDGFDERLEAARRQAGLDAAAKPVRAAGDAPHPLTFAFRLGAEMVAALLVACAIGWGLDRLLGTRPWLMVAFVPIGVAAGVINLLRASGSAGRSGPPRRGRGWG